MLFLIGCGPDPDWVEQKVALAHWEEGKSLLEQGDPERAAESFGRARALQPGDPVLLVWEGRALAETGELPAALARIDEALALQPGFAEARYERAVVLARVGRPDEAGMELERALREGAASPRIAIADPAFAPWLGHPAFAFLPPPIAAVLTAQPATVFLGEEARVKLVVRGASQGALSLEPSRWEGPVELREVVETRKDGPDGGVIEVEWTLTAIGAGPFPASPGVGVHLDAWTTSADGAPLLAVAPPGTPVQVRNLPLDAPSSRLKDRVGPTAWYDGGVCVLAPPSAIAALVPPPEREPIVYATESQSARCWDGAGATEVTISEQGTVVFQGLVQPPQGQLDEGP